MIYTVTFNPSLDYIVSVKILNWGIQTGQVPSCFFRAGRAECFDGAWATLESNTAFGFAGFVGEEIVRRIEEMGVKAELVWIGDGVSRINLKLKSIDGTEINGCGPGSGEGDVQKLIAKLELLQAGDVLVLAGSIPGSVPDDIYRRIMSEMSGRGIEVVVDATKELLVNVLEYHPFLIKPNHHELGGIFGVELKTREDAIPYAGI